MQTIKKKHTNEIYKKNAIIIDFYEFCNSFIFIFGFLTGWLLKYGQSFWSALANDTSSYIPISSPVSSSSFNTLCSCSWNFWVAAVVGSRLRLPSCCSAWSWHQICIWPSDRCHILSSSTNHWEAAPTWFIFARMCVYSLTIKNGSIRSINLWRIWKLWKFLHCDLLANGNCDILNTYIIYIYNYMCIYMFTIFSIRLVGLFIQVLLYVSCCIKNFKSITNVRLFKDGIT